MTRSELRYWSLMYMLWLSILACAKIGPSAWRGFCEQSSRSCLIAGFLLLAVILGQEWLRERGDR